MAVASGHNMICSSVDFNGTQILWMDTSKSVKVKKKKILPNFIKYNKFAYKKPRKLEQGGLILPRIGKHFLESIPGLYFSVVKS